MNRFYIAILAAICSTTSCDVHCAPIKNGGASTEVYGTGASLRGVQFFPKDNSWNTDITHAPVSRKSDVYINSIGRETAIHPDFGTRWNGQPWGIPYVVVPSNLKKVPVTFQYKSESDVGPYPIPDRPPIEGGEHSTQDRHVLIVDRQNAKLFELFDVHPPDGQHADWRAGAGAIFDLRKNDFRPAGWTSADAAGLPILPGLTRWDEVYESKEIPHALRFTVAKTRRAYMSPARHFASQSTDPNLPPMGLRVRLKSSFDATQLPTSAQVIVRCLKKYGMFLADNGKDWFISGAPDPRWDDLEISTLKRLKGGDFEVVDSGIASDGRY